MKQLFSIREREKTWRIIIIVVMVSSFIFSAIISFKSYQLLETSKKNIYVMTNNNSLIQAQATDITNSYDILCKEAAEHINLLIFQQVPDIDQINIQLQQAKNISDNSTLNLIDSYVQNNFYNSIVSQNYFTILNTDSISINYSMNPHYFKYYGKLKLLRDKNSSLRDIITEGYLKSTNASSIGNPKGYYFSNFKLLEDKKIN